MIHKKANLYLFILNIFWFFGLVGIYYKTAPNFKKIFTELAEKNIKIPPFTNFYFNYYNWVLCLLALLLLVLFLVNKKLEFNISKKLLILNIALFILTGIIGMLYVTSLFLPIFNMPQ